MIHGYLGPQDWFPLSVAADRSMVAITQRVGHIVILTLIGLTLCPVYT